MERSISFRSSDVLREEICTVRVQANVLRRELQSLLPSIAYGESWEIKEIIDWLEKIEKTASDGESCPDNEVENYYFAIKVFQDSLKVKLASVDHPELIGVLW